jgi:hypothetical protein
MKKFLSIALALLMVCVMLPVVALADDTSLPTAENGVITLTENVTLSNTWNISSDVIIDLNGHKLTINNGTAIYVSGGSFTVKDSGQNGEMALDGTISLMNTTMRLENGTVSFHQRQTGISLLNSKFVMTDGMVYAAVQESFCFNPGYGGTTTIDISGGTVKSVSTNTAMIGCGSIGSYNLDISISGNTTVDFANELMNGEGNNKVSFEITGGTFTGNVTEYAGNNLVVSDGTNYYVGDTATSVVSNATSGTFTVVNGTDVNLTVKGGVTVKNGMTEGTVTVNGKTLEATNEYTAPTVIIISGDTTPAETPKTEDQKNPSTGANDFVGLAAAAAVVALLGSAVVLRKK